MKIMSKDFSNLFIGVFLVLALEPISAKAQTLFTATSHPNLWSVGHTTNDVALAGNFIASSGTSLGNSWGLYANTGQTAAMTYNFGQLLQPDGFVEIGISLGFNNGGTVGFALQNSSFINRFEAYYIGNDATDAFKLNDLGGQENITGPSTSFSISSWKAATPDFQLIRFTLNASNQYQLTFDGVNVSNTGLVIAASDISQIRIFNYNAGTTSDNNQFFNNLTVSIPEPSTPLLMGLGLAGLLTLRRIRKA